MLILAWVGKEVLNRGDLDLGDEGGIPHVTISSDPPGAAVWLDDTKTSLTTPASVPVFSGTHRHIILRHPDYLERQVPLGSVLAAGDEGLNVALQPGARFELETEPAGAEATITGYGSLTTPGFLDRALPAGSHEVHIALAGYVPRTIEFEVLGTTPYSLEVTLEAGFEVYVTSTPSGANIWVDGEDTNRVTPSDLVLPIDKAHAVAVRKTGYTRPWRRVQAMGAGERTEVHLEMEHVERRRVQRQLERVERDMQRLEDQLARLLDSDFVLSASAGELRNRRRQAAQVQQRLDALNLRAQNLLDELARIDNEIVQ